jgi:hypothetical protein
MRRFALSAVLLLFAALPAAGEIVDRIAATVNDTAIPESEVREAMLFSALEKEQGEDPEAFRARVLDALIDQHLEYEDAVRFGPAPPDAAEINAELEKLRARLKAEGKDPDAEFAKAGMTADDVRASIERQLVVARYLRERFAPIAFADEAQAREEYEKHYLPEQAAGGLPVEPFESVAEPMRRRSSERAFDEEVAKWLKDLRQKSRISIYRIPAEILRDRTPIVFQAAPSPTPTRTP